MERTKHHTCVTRVLRGIWVLAAKTTLPESFHG